MGIVWKYQRKLNLLKSKGLLSAHDNLSTKGFKLIHFLALELFLNIPHPNILLKGQKFDNYSSVLGAAI